MTLAKRTHLAASHQCPTIRGTNSRRLILGSSLYIQFQSELIRLDPHQAGCADHHFRHAIRVSVRGKYLVKVNIYIYIYTNPRRIQHRIATHLFANTKKKKRSRTLTINHRLVLESFRFHPRVERRNTPRDVQRWNPKTINWCCASHYPNYPLRDQTTT